MQQTILESENTSNSDILSSLRNFPNIYYRNPKNDYEKLNNLYQKLEKCGKEKIEYLNPENEIVELVSYCDNRCCKNKGCKSHRFYQYMKKHNEQIQLLNKTMRKPKAWIFTGYKKDLSDFTRKFLRQNLIDLYKIVDSYALTEFSIHMELKLNNDGTAYLHWHVVCGGFVKDIRFLMKIWKRKIRYEQAIKPKELGFYVSKYTMKSPKFQSNVDLELYHLLVYKTQLSRFSIVNEVENSNNGWYSLDGLRREINDSYRYGKLSKSTRYNLVGNFRPGENEINDMKHFRSLYLEKSNQFWSRLNDAINECAKKYKR